jgi:hypothetical protein
MSFARHFRVKAELYGLLLAHSDNVVDRAWYAGLIRSYNLLAAAEDRHYHQGLRSIPTAGIASPARRDAVSLDAEIVCLLRSYMERKTAA